MHVVGGGCNNDKLVITGKMYIHVHARTFNINNNTLTKQCYNNCSLVPRLYSAQARAWERGYNNQYP